MRSIWLPITTVVLILYTLIGTANADWFSMAMPRTGTNAEPFYLCTLGAGLFGTAALIRKSFPTGPSDQKNDFDRGTP